MEDEKIDQPTKKRSLKTRYIKTRLIKSLDELASQEFVYFNGKLVHRGWFLNWQLKMTITFLEQSRLHCAEVKEA